MSAISTSAMRYFLAVAKAGSFRSAADVLHVSASAINRQISILEASLGAPLLQRSRGRNQLKVTSAGEILLVHARAATASLEQARTEIEALKGLRIGTIAIGAPESSVDDFLPDFLMRFRKAHPGLSFRIFVGSPSEITQRLLRDDIEVAFIYHPPARTLIKIAARIEKPNCIMVRADHPLAKRSSVRLSECSPYPLVMPENGTLARELYDEMLAKASMDPTWVVTTNSYQMLRSAARAGLGASIVSDYLTEKRRPSNAVLVPLRDCPPAVLACCTRNGRKLSVAATVFIEQIRQFFASLDG